MILILLCVFVRSLFENGPKRTAELDYQFVVVFWNMRSIALLFLLCLAYLGHHLHARHIAVQIHVNFPRFLQLLEITTRYKFLGSLEPQSLGLHC
jgi:hypothetical protein